MPPDISQRVVRWHPAILTMVLLAGLVAQLSVSGMTLSPIARGVLMLFPLGPMCLWLWAVFNVARRASPATISGRWDWVYALPVAVSFAAGIAGWPTENSLAATVVFLSLFVGLSLSAKTFENVAAPNGNAPVGRILMTALLMYMAPVGLWLLHARILRVAARANPGLPV